ncbi:MAG: TetR/AcrR family transcriptional regulator [Gemmatimonadaceae bacterium]|jgi:AcrR family transcriptional regulator|nr:TetR/AcrR family transcriptional regulator [Gemmatimonadaceae bacterium]
MSGRSVRPGRGRPSTQDDQRLAEGRRTTAELVRQARRLFSTHGYHGTSTTQLVEATGLTRGALYHHFADKAALFAAVFEQVYGEIGDAVERAAARETDTWAQLVAGCDAFVVSGADASRARIAFVDGPGVLGPERWAAIDREHAEAGLESLLSSLQRDGLVRAAPLDALTQVLSGGMNAAVLWVAHATSSKRALAEARAAVRAVIEGLRVRA